MLCWKVESPPTPNFTRCFPSEIFKFKFKFQIKSHQSFTTHFCRVGSSKKIGLASGKKKEPKPNLFGPDIFGWGGGPPREGVGAKKFGMSLETREIKLLWRDIPGFCWDIPGTPEKFEKKKFLFSSHPLIGDLQTAVFVYNCKEISPPCFTSWRVSICMLDKLGLCSIKGRQNGGASRSGLVRPCADTFSWVLQESFPSKRASQRSYYAVVNMGGVVENTTAWQFVSLVRRGPLGTASGP